MGVLSRITVMVCLAAALIATPAAATIYVSASNLSGIQDGSAAYPYRTIGQAVIAAVPGTSWDDAPVVLVSPGSYSGYAYMKSFVKLVGTDARSVRINGNITAAAGDPQPNIWIEKVNFSYGSIQAWNRVRITDPSFWEVRDCGFFGVEFPIYARGAAFVNLTRCLFYDSDSAVHLYYTSGVTSVTNCTIARGSCEDEGIALYYPTTTNRVELANTIIFDTSRGIGSWGAYPTPANSSAWQVTADHCCFYLSSVPAGVNKIACLTVNPLFRGYAAGSSYWDQFTLANNSPCIDAGVDVGLPFAGAAPDIGYKEQVHYESLPELLKELEVSFSDLDQESLKSPSEQRRDAFCNKMDAVLKQYHVITADLVTVPDKLAAYIVMRDKLVGDLLGKCDQNFGGNPSNDWIDDAADRNFFHDLVSRTITLINAEIVRLGGSV